MVQRQNSMFPRTEVWEIPGRTSISRRTKKVGQMLSWALAMDWPSLDLPLTTTNPVRRSAAWRLRENVVSSSEPTATEIAPVINYHDTGGGAHYSGDNPFPSLSIGSGVDDFVIEATGTIIIPTTGSWTFGVNSDDGFQLDLSNGNDSFSSSHPNPRGPGDTLKTFNVTQAGSYTARLIMYERGGGAEVEFFAAQGTHGSWNASNFDLVGDVSRGGLEVFTSANGEATGAASFRTNVELPMRNINASVYVRAPFMVTDPG